MFTIRLMNTIEGVMSQNGYGAPLIGPFVDLDWLSAHANEAALVDIRWYLDGRPGLPSYERAHIPGAVYLEFDEVLSEPHESNSGGRHPLPTPERFAGGLAAAGIGDEDPVVAYDDTGGVIAARLVWLLRAIGHPAAVLDGGLGAWPPEALVAGPSPARAPRRFTPTPWPADRFADIDAAAQAGRAGDVVLIDARDRKRFAGGPDPIDPRSGHIPGARSVPAREHVAADGRIRSADELRRAFAVVGIRPGTPVVSYCGSGVTACYNLLALERAGLGPGRLFPGSWSQWSRDPDRPVETGEDRSS